MTKKAQKIKVGVVSCSYTQSKEKGTAVDVHSASTLFSRAYEYAARNYDEVYLLSSKYGLLIPFEKIEPYDMNIADFRAHELQAWAKVAASILKKRYSPHRVKFYFHIGEKFYPILKYLEGYEVELPMKGIGGIGKQISFYNKKLEK